MFMYIFFPSGILTMIMVRTLRKDIARYNRDDDIVSQQFAADLSEFYDLKGKEKKKFQRHFIQYRRWVTFDFDSSRYYFSFIRKRHWRRQDGNWSMGTYSDPPNTPRPWPLSWGQGCRSSSWPSSLYVRFQVFISACTKNNNNKKNLWCKKILRENILCFITFHTLFFVKM